MRLNLTKPIVIFDLETTGIDLVKDRIIQISYIKVYPDGKEERGNELVNPEKPIFAGFNSNHFDIPLLAEEFLRAGVDFDFSKSRMIDACTIFKRMERRNLAAAYKFYCGRKMEDDFEAHRADQDTEATYRVLMGELDKYAPGANEDEEKVLENDMDKLAEFSKMNNYVDFAGRIIWAEMKDGRGNVLLDRDGNPRMTEVFNFGKHKGIPVADVLQIDPGYYSWILAGDFTYNTKQVLTRIRLREANLNG